MYVSLFNAQLYKIYPFWYERVFLCSSVRVYLFRVFFQLTLTMYIVHIYYDTLFIFVLYRCNTVFLVCEAFTIEKFSHVQHTVTVQSHFPYIFSVYSRAWYSDDCDETNCCALSKGRKNFIYEK